MISMNTKSAIENQSQITIMCMLQLGELDTSTDDGVSLAMATTFSVPERIPMLLVHSMIHLVG